MEENAPQGSQENKEMTYSEIADLEREKRHREYYRNRWIESWQRLPFWERWDFEIRKRITITNGTLPLVMPIAIFLVSGGAAYLLLEMITIEQPEGFWMWILSAGIGGLISGKHFVRNIKIWQVKRFLKTYRKSQEQEGDDSEEEMELSLDEILAKRKEFKKRHNQPRGLTRLRYELRAKIACLDLHYPIVTPLIILVILGIFGFEGSKFIFSEPQEVYLLVIMKTITSFMGISLALLRLQRNIRFRSHYKNLFKDFDIKN